jgi:hypothetical protein
MYLPMEKPRMPPPGERTPPPVKPEFDQHEAPTRERRDVAKKLAEREAEISGTHPAFNDDAPPQRDENDPDKTPAKGTRIRP